MDAAEAEDRYARLIAARQYLNVAKRRAEATERDLNAAHAWLAEAQARLNAASAEYMDCRIPLQRQ